ncbi:MAG: ABC transporter ATP-binding protein [bacterium]|nr:ABC transporter ATP-binding protein [bacterium]MCY3953888.1 ABC transporter ATP-binding protein [bacterium]MCY4103850.1 ABC transporter ATP-binding protein [bacterium]
MNAEATAAGPVVEVRELVKDYVTRDARLRQRISRAVDGVSFRIHAGETFAIVGESGSGKTTVGRVLLKLTSATDGTVVFRGDEILDIKERHFRPARRHMQMVFQDPLAAFDPQATIRSSLREFTRLRGIQTRAEENEAIAEAVRSVGLEPEIANRRPSQVSGGQLQRLSIARSLLPEPHLLFLDEPTSSLDVSIRGQIVNLLLDLQEQNELAFLLVAHDLRVVYAMAHQVAVMYLGQFVEVGSRDQVYANARHPYTRGLLDAAELDEPPRRGEPVRLVGEISEEAAKKPGCRLTLRCPFAVDRCEEPQPLRETEAGHLVRCWRAIEQPVEIGLPSDD